ncbi:DUF3365 domain-containing protein [Pleurocapsa sp. PCC 7319]|uniref:c-type heme family protein n=1 Tax=Pleurocapsa sp. PCC 7319 TaxID=118161 RepID=UPI00034D3EEB|nr:DUF3365 domain-containing protein [Pleurocapsa sp. PCC 7319]
MFAFKTFRLSTKLNLILATVLICTIGTCSLFLSIVLNRKVEQEVADKAFLIIETMNSVRNYTDTQVKPELEAKLTSQPSFIPETVPAYSAREVFEELRTQPKYQDFLYKEATLNPTNPRDRADSFETQITQQFRQNKQLSEKTGFRSQENQNFYYVARPLAINKASCLECHSTPSRAPRNLINTYGTENGFGWQLNEIVASQMIYVPAEKVYAAARKIKISVIGIFILFFLIAIAITNLFLNQLVLKPIKNIAKLATEISTGNLEQQFQQDSKDELALLAKALNRMILSLRMALEMINEDK